ncbi:predicted protein [Histoplasma capsulatum G186AR]|uniref:Uncharacterized protein n=1 Tax=Ajellomyces capsulatus (strain G186AR / H82 / ATCC MYA-2454 / RMSCC 2432) TaxID=447093 RepID=C0NKS1_AJECG|nr:uncharacterized protein HCBG_03751 [Histoplasma capsulatum G186AR]EEH08462.1 predicted protein [Histoplasma capsulatum G186AR]
MLAPAKAYDNRSFFSWALRVGDLASFRQVAAVPFTNKFNNLKIPVLLVYTILERFMIHPVTRTSNQRASTVASAQPPDISRSKVVYIHRAHIPQQFDRGQKYNPGCFIQCLAATTPSSFPVHGFQEYSYQSLVSNTKRMVNTRNINEQPVPWYSTHYALHRLPPWCQLEFARWSGNRTESEHRVFVRTPEENVFKWKLDWVGVEVGAESWARRQPAASLWQTLYYTYIVVPDCFAFSPEASSRAEAIIILLC